MEKKTDHNSQHEEIIIEDIDLKDDVIEEIVDEKVSKNAHAKKLIDNSKELISTIDRDVSETKDIVSQHITLLQNAKHRLSDDTISQSKALLERAKHPYRQEDDFEPFEIQLATANEDISVKDISTGWFSGLILAVLGMLSTALAWFFVSSKMIGEPLSLEKIPTKELILEKLQNEALFSWIGDNPQIGMAVMGVSILFIGLLIYKLRVSTKENKNLKIANDTFEKSNNYVKTQEKSKSEILTLDQHLREVTPLIENYKVLLDEQNAKLIRILHIEGELESNADYERTSQEVMADTEKLMESVQRLISTSMTKEGQVNELSKNALIDTRVLYESYLSKLYA